MKVWVVSAYESYPSFSIVGVFSSEERATKEAKKVPSGWEECLVEELTLDERDMPE